MSNLVYRYGLLAPTVNADLVDAQMRAAHTYRNRLTEIERERRGRLRAIDTGHAELCALHVEVTRTREALDAAVSVVIAERKRATSADLAERRKTDPNAKPRAKRPDTPEQRERIRAAREAARVARNAWMGRRAEVLSDTVATADRDQANALAHDDRIVARAQCGVYWGTYQLVEDADNAARKAPLWDGDQPSDPRFLGWRGEGAVSVQIVGGLSLDALRDAGSTQVRVDESPDMDLGHRMGTSRRRQLRRRCVLWLRVGSDAARNPVWAQWPMVLHRPLPDGAQIQRVTVHVRRIGPRDEWYATFTLRVAPPVPSPLPGAVAVDVGWRLRPDGQIRVAAVCSDSGEVYEIILPQEIVSGLARADSLRATRDKNLNAARDALVAQWLANCIDGLPAEWRERIETLAQWRSAARFAGLAIWWRDHRLVGDDTAFDALEVWRRQDKHLWLWETSQRTGTLRRRKDCYRVIAAKLADRFGALVLEKDAGLKTFARHAPVESETPENTTARSNRVLAAVSELRECLRNAFTRRGGNVVELPAEHTTTTCSVCGLTAAFDAAGSVQHTCANGHRWDQDANAARNLLARWRERSRAAPEADPARIVDPAVPTESRWARAKRLGRERNERQGLSHAAPE